MKSCPTLCLMPSRFAASGECATMAMRRCCLPLLLGMLLDPFRQRLHGCHRSVIDRHGIAARIELAGIDYFLPNCCLQRLSRLAVGFDFQSAFSSVASGEALL